MYYIVNIADNPFTDVNACSGISTPFDPCSGVSKESPSGALDETDSAYNDVMKHITAAGKVFGDLFMELLWGKLHVKFPKGGADATFSN